MEGNKTYVSILRNTLVRKYQVLTRYIEVMEDFEKQLDDNTITAETFDKILSEREELIKQLDSLDSGFESIYTKVELEIKANKGAYEEDIKVMQEYIPRITDLGVKISAIESKNKSRIETFLATKKQEVKSFKISSKTATNYYKNMYGSHGNIGMNRMDAKK